HVENDKAGAAAIEGGGEAGAGGLMVGVDEIGVAGGRVGKIHDEAIGKALVLAFGRNIGAGAHAQKTGHYRFEGGKIGIEGGLLRRIDLGAKAEEDAMAKHFS